METRLPRLCVLGKVDGQVLENLVSFCNACQRNCQCSVFCKHFTASFGLCILLLIFVLCYLFYFVSECVCVAWLFHSVYLHWLCNFDSVWSCGGEISCAWKQLLSSGISCVGRRRFLNKCCCCCCVYACAHFLTGLRLLLWKGNCSCLPAPFPSVCNKTHMALWTSKHVFNGVSTAILKLDRAFRSCSLLL